MYCKLIPALTNTTMLAYLNTSKRILDWQGIKQDLNLVGAYDLKWSQKHWVLWIVDWISTEFYFSHFYLFRENSGKQKEIGSLESQVYRLVELVGVSLWVTLNCVWSENVKVFFFFSLLYSIRNNERPLVTMLFVNKQGQLMNLR